MTVDDARRWSARYTQSAENFIAENAKTKKIAEKLIEYRVLLQNFPGLGRPYDPSYPAARPPFPCRVIAVPDTPFDIYYIKDDEEKAVTIFAVEFKTGNPLTRFSSL